MIEITTKQQSIAEFLSSPVIQKNIESVVGERKQQFITSVASLVNSNEALQRVDRKSLFAACLVAASLDLPSTPTSDLLTSSRIKIRLSSRWDTRDLSN